MSTPIDRGSTVLVEVTFKRQTPFGTLDYFDPATPKISIKDPNGTTKVDAADLTKSALGKYYYICQTATAWMPGNYSTTATGVDGTYSDIDVNASAFELK